MILGDPERGVNPVPVPCGQKRNESVCTYYNEPHYTSEHLFHVSDEEMTGAAGLLGMWPSASMSNEGRSSGSKRLNTTSHRTKKWPRIGYFEKSSLQMYECGTTNDNDLTNYWICRWGLTERRIGGLKLSDLDRIKVSEVSLDASLHHS